MKIVKKSVFQHHGDDFTKTQRRWLVSLLFQIFIHHFSHIHNTNFLLIKNIFVKINEFRYISEDGLAKLNEIEPSTQDVKEIIQRALKVCFFRFGFIERKYYFENE